MAHRSSPSEKPSSPSAARRFGTLHPPAIARGATAQRWIALHGYRRSASNTSRLPQFGSLYTFVQKCYHIRIKVGFLRRNPTLMRMWCEYGANSKVTPRLSRSLIQIPHVAPSSPEIRQSAQGAALTALPARGPPRLRAPIFQTTNSTAIRQNNPGSTLATHPCPRAERRKNFHKE